MNLVLLLEVGEVQLQVRDLVLEHPLCLVPLLRLPALDLLPLRQLLLPLRERGAQPVGLL